MTRVKWFSEFGIDAVEDVGGKNASLGEMYRKLSRVGVQVPNGFATTADAYREFIRENDLQGVIDDELSLLDRDDVDDLHERAKRIRTAILGGRLPVELRAEVDAAYLTLSEEAGVDLVDVAVRSSATAEDLPEASFAGQQETYLMVHGLADVQDAILRCFASLYTTRAVSYRLDMGIDDEAIALSACIQRMVRADRASSGVIFTLDTDSGFRDVVYVTSTWGLGENIVQGRVVPDSFVVHKERLLAGFSPLVSRQLGDKEQTMSYDARGHRITNDPTPPSIRNRFSISDVEAMQLARWAIEIEDHYSAIRGIPTPMDIEWAKDGRTGEMFIVQARPETVHSQNTSRVAEVFHFEGTGEPLATGLAIGGRVATGPVRRVTDPSEMRLVEAGDVLVTQTTDPDWEPILRKAAAVITERGGRTSHAAIVARELGIPAIVAVGDVHEALPDGLDVTVSCAEGEVGRIYDGILPFTIETIDLDTLPTIQTRLNVNLGDPSAAYAHAQLPVAGVGLARMEFIYASQVGVHPLALTRIDTLESKTRAAVEARTAGYEEPTEFLVDQLAQGVGTLAAAFWPRPVLLRFSDFKTNEYAGLLGGSGFEPVEPNPMIGWRGASRYAHDDFADGFALEVAAIRRVREEMGFTNLHVMVPFCRTPEQGVEVLDELGRLGLVRGLDGLQIWVMAELPSNVFCAPEFAELFDGFSIGSNDLTQLVLGVDRDCEAVAPLFDERHPAVTRAISTLIEEAHKAGRPIGICGQAPSDHVDFAGFLVERGIDSISVTPDAVGRTISTIADAESELRVQAS
ncbi:MAG: phosphoenolpyruvate synthase [Acidimicrobiales bacterium]